MAIGIAENGRHSILGVSCALSEAEVKESLLSPAAHLTALKEALRIAEHRIASVLTARSGCNKPGGSA